jgi:hypothetical protein
MTNWRIWGCFFELHHKDQGVRADPKGESKRRVASPDKPEGFVKFARPRVARITPLQVADTRGKFARLRKKFLSSAKRAVMSVYMERVQGFFGGEKGQVKFIDSFLATVIFFVANFIEVYEPA